MSAWIFTRCLLQSLYGCAVFYFCHRLLGAKMAPRIACAVMILYEVLFKYLFLDKILDISYFFSIFISQLGLVLLILLLFRGGLSKKLAFSSVIFTIQELTVYAVMPLLTRCADLIAAYVFHTALPLFVMNLILVMQYLLNCFIIYKVSRGCSELSKNIPNKLSLLILVPSVFILIMLEFVYYACNEQQIFLLLSQLNGFHFSLLRQLVDPVILFLLSVLGLASNLIIVFGTNRAMQQQLTKQQLSIQITHYQELEKQDHELRKIRHDLKNHIIGLLGLLSGNDIDSARNYLYRIAEKSDLAESLIKTGNHTADAVINAKYNKAQQSGIDFQCDMKLPTVKISDFDLCVILGNALDNAIEACNRIAAPDLKKFISIQSVVVKSYFIIEIKNSTENRDSANASLATIKADSGEHGIGLNNIKETVEKHRGIMDIAVQSEMFCLSIMLPR